MPENQHNDDNQEAELGQRTSDNDDYGAENR
jgi:hypothetical protein